MGFALTSHKKDLDGISSAALMVRYFTKHRPGPYYLVLKDYPDGEKVIDDLLLDSGGYELYISDLATDQKFIDQVAERLARVKSHGNRVTWMDHHPTRPEVVEMLSKVVDVLDLRQSTITGSQIVYDRLYTMNGVEDAHARLLSSLGRDSDLMEYRFPVTPRLVTLIDYYNYLDAESAVRPNLIQLALHLSFPSVEADPERLLEPYHLEQVKQYEGMKEREKKKVLENVEEITAGGLKFAVFEYPRLFSGTAICSDVLDVTGADGCVGFSDEGSGSVRRSNERISCRAIAQLLGGGGHEFAAGFNIGFPIVDAEGRRRARGLILEKIHQVYGP